MQLSNIHVSESWRTAAEHALDGGGPVLVLGGVDTGKTTFVRYLLAQFIAQRGMTALLDGDVGMAIVGPSGLLGLTLVADVDTLGERPGADRSWFIGSTTPVGFLVPMLLGHSRLIGLAREARVPVVLNTGGLVQGSAAKALHLAVADIVQPRTVIGLQVAHEIEHILTPIEGRGIDVVRVEPSPRVVRKPRSFRVRLRSERFAAYFEQGETRDVPLAQFSIEGTMLGSHRPLADEARQPIEGGLDSFIIEAQEAGDGVALVLASAPHRETAGTVEQTIDRRGIHVIESAATTGLLTGLLAADGECLGLGLLDSWKGDGMVSLFTPLDEAQLHEVKRLGLGSIRLGHNGEDFGRWEREACLTGGEDGDRGRAREDEDEDDA